MQLSKTVLISMAGLASCHVAPRAQAYLGSFGPSDGYNLSVPVGAVNWSDVSYFNAGGYGPNAGNGAGPTLGTPNGGLWQITGPVGGFFTTAAARNANTPPNVAYSGVLPPGTQPAYIVGDHFPGRNNDGSNLAVRNDTPLGTGPLNYEYSLDTFDFGGPTPASIVSGTVTTRFYFCPNPADASNAGLPPQDKFIMSFVDAGGAIGAQWGYARDNEVYWRPGSSGAWNYTGVYANAANWDGIRFAVDLTADTFKLDYYVVASNTWTNLAPAGTALGVPMANLTRLGWQLEDGVTTGVGGKNFFDDFSFNVPAPATLPAFGVLALLATRRRRA